MAHAGPDFWQGRLRPFALAAATPALLAGFARPVAAQAPQPGVRIAPPASAPPPEARQWTMPMRDSANTRYSALDEINTPNVARLQVAFTFSTGLDRGQESAPIVVGETMFVLTPYPNILYGPDLSQPGAPMRWTYEPKPAAAAQGFACCDTVNRGPVWSGTIATAGNLVFYGTMEGW